MSVYIDVPFVTDPDDLATQAFDFIQSRFPGWVPSDGNLETITIESIALFASALAFQASGVPSSIFRWLGPLVDVEPIDAAAATVASTWTAIDNAGYTIAAGTHVGIRLAGDTLVPFTVVADVTIPAGSTATAAGGVQLQAVAAGSVGSGLGTVGGALTLIDPVGWVSSIVQTALTAGGADAESDIAYLGRLRSELQLLAPRPILPADFAILARTVAGVYRAVAIDGYNPADSSSGNPRCVAISAVDSSGLDVGTTIDTAISTLLQAKREQNFLVHTFAPTYTQVDVTFAIAVSSGYDPATAVANVTAAIDAFLAPATWGIPDGDPLGWLDETFVRYTDLIYVVRRAAGVDHIVSLYFNKHVALGTFTVTVASPAVVTKATHGLSVGDPVILTTTGALPTGLLPNVVYYVQAVVDANTFKLAATAGGAAINTTGTQSGVHTIYKTGTADITITGPAALPQVGTITGSYT